MMYCGTLVNDSQSLSSIDWPVLGIFGSVNTGIPVFSIVAFNESLNQLGVDKETYIYEGAGHAFANPLGAQYAPNETRDAWSKTLDF